MSPSAVNRIATAGLRQDASKPLTKTDGTMLVLLAHQDDELMLAPLIADAKRNAKPVVVVYLTNGDGGGADPIRRNRETERFLASIGIEAKQEIAFLGTDLAISDGKLYCSLPQAHEALLSLPQLQSPVADVYTHAWEGGNPDHDAAHVLALGAAHALGIGTRVFQVPFYRSPRRGPLPFVLYAPLAANGPVTYFRLGMWRRLKRIADIGYFPSQSRTFIRFWPMMLVDALASPGVPIQPTNTVRLTQRPMPEPMRYERINYIDFSNIVPYVERYWQAFGPTAARRRPSATTDRDVSSSLGSEEWMRE